MTRLRDLTVSVLLATTLAAATERTERSLIHENFESVAVGQVPKSAITVWPGGAGEPLGNVGVQAIPNGGQALRMTNAAHAANRAPSAGIKWPLGSGSEVVAVSVEYRFMIPIDGPYLSVTYLGGDWKTGAAVFMAGNGNFTVQYGEHEARIAMGTYEPNRWYTIRFDVDSAERTVSVFLDGKKKLNRLPWQPGASAVTRVNVFADFANTDHRGEPVLYLDDVTVKTLARRP